MPKSALPEYIDEPKEWIGTDWDNWLQRPLLNIKHWFAFSSRATEWWAKWREFPITLLAIRGKGLYRVENTDGSQVLYLDEEILFRRKLYGFYLSAIQYWCRWHFAIQWPLHITFHVYFSQKNVPTFPTRPNKDIACKLFYFRCGARRDADKVYWFPSLFIGLTWN